MHQVNIIVFVDTHPWNLFQICRFGTLTFDGRNSQLRQDSYALDSCTINHIVIDIVILRALDLILKSIFLNYLMLENMMNFLTIFKALNTNERQKKLDVTNLKERELSSVS